MNAEQLPFLIQDLMPKEMSFKLSTRPGETFVLKPFSLLARTWAIDRWGYQGVHDLMVKQDISKIAEIAHFLLKEKQSFPTVAEFMEAIITHTDFVEILQATLGTIGIGEPEIQKINKALEGKEPPGPNRPSPNPAKRKIGAKSLTRSPHATRGARPKLSST